MTYNRQIVSRAKATPPFYIGIDLGGTNIKIGLVDDNGHTLAYKSIPTHVEQGPEPGARRMGEAVLSLVAEVGLQPTDIARVGLATPGTMDIAAGKLLEPGNLPGWHFFAIRDAVSRYAANLPVTYANDANAACYGEFWMGSGAKFHSMVFLTLGTGVGGGIIVGGNMIDGEHSAGGEVGHIILDPGTTARECSLGRGHLEAYCSATAIVARAEDLLAQGRGGELAERKQTGQPITALAIANAAESGDHLAHDIVMELAGYLGLGIVSLIHVIDPNGVVLGGAMNFGGHETKTGVRFLDEVRRVVKERGLRSITQDLVIDYALLEGDAGYLGAAGLARLQHQRQKAS